MNLFTLAPARRFACDSCSENHEWFSLLYVFIRLSVCVCLENVKLSETGHNKWLWLRQSELCSVLFCVPFYFILWNLFEFWALLWVYSQCQIISSRSNHKIPYASLDIYLSGPSWLRAKQIEFVVRLLLQPFWLRYYVVKLGAYRVSRQVLTHPSLLIDFPSPTASTHSN